MTGERSKKKKVLFVIGSFHVGGAEMQLSVLAAELVKRGRQVHLFSLESDGPLRGSLEQAGVHTHIGAYDSRAPRWLKVLLLARAQIYLFLLALKLRPQVLHAFLPLTNFMGALAGRMAGVGTVITSRRALGTHQERHCWWPWFDRVANRLSTVVTGNSQAVIDDTVRRDGVARQKMRLIYNGLNFQGDGVFSTERGSIRNSLGLKENEVAIVYVANLIPYKGHLDLVEAISSLYRKYPEIRLFLVGEDRGIEPFLREHAEQLGAIAAIEMLGRRDDVSRVLCAMDVGVMASHEEGCSNALLEKLAAGLPVAATAVGGNPEVLTDMPGCVLTPPKSAVALAEAIESLIGRERQPSMLACERIERVRKRFSVVEMIDAHERIYWREDAGHESRAREKRV